MTYAWEAALKAAKAGDEKRKAKWTAAARAMLAAGRESGALDMPDVGATANGLVAAIHGLLTLAKVRNDLSVLPESETVLLRLAGRYS